MGDDREAWRSPTWDQLDKRRFFTLGPMFSVAVRAMLYPPTLIKTRIQAQEGNAVYKSGRDAFVKIVKAEGVSGLYRGFFPSLMGVFVGQTYLACYEMTRAKAQSYCDDGKCESQSPSDFVPSMVAGFTASVVAQTIGVPIDITTQRLMVSTDERSGSGVRAQFQRGFALAKGIVAKSGIRGLYRGYLLQVMQFSPASGIWWASYNKSCDVLHESFPLRSPGSEVTHQMVLSAVAAGIATSISICITNPIDVVRTRYQVGEKQRVAEVIRTLVAESGVRGFWKGLAPRWLASAPSAAIMITYYETVKRYSFIASDDAGDA